MKDGIVYCSASSEEYDIGTPEGMTEIKASEFYTIVEGGK